MNYLSYYAKFTILSICMIALSATVFADVKIKSKQTMSGQSYENTTYIKGKRQRTETMGGMMVNLTQCDLRRGVQMNPNAKTYIVNSFDQSVETSNQKVSNTQGDGVVRAGGTVTTTITTKDTGERKQMFGFTAKHLIITMETASSADACAVTNSKMQMDGWYIDAEFVLDCDQNATNYQNYNTKKSGCQDKYQIKQNGTVKRGYPVYEKMTMFDENGKESFSTVNEVVELSKATLDASLFEVPSDYREVSDASAMYAAAGNSMSMSAISGDSNASDGSLASSSPEMQTAVNASRNSSILSTEVGAKKAGVVRIGVTYFKTSAVGEGMNATDLSNVIQNTIAEYLKMPNIELVQLEAKLPSAATAEAAQKECDFVIFGTVSHKNGGGGFGGMFSKVIAPTIGQTGIGHTGSTVGNVAGQVATVAIVSAGKMAANVKNKDTMTLDLDLQTASGSAVLNKQFKTKAKSDGEDIISPLSEQAAQAIVTATGKK